MVSDWPSQPPDLNVIENLWAILKNRVFKRNPKNIDTLWTIINEEFFNIDNETIKKLYDSIPNRMNSVIKNRGYPTKYSTLFSRFDTYVLSVFIMYSPKNSFFDFVQIIFLQSGVQYIYYSMVYIPS